MDEREIYISRSSSIYRRGSQTIKESGSRTTPALTQVGQLPVYQVPVIDILLRAFKQLSRFLGIA